MLDRLVPSRRRHSPMAPAFDSLVELFSGFHPARKPVLWRVLVTQYLLYRALPDENPELEPLTPDEIERFDWRRNAEAPGDFRMTLEIAEEFVARDLASLRERLKR
jgi:hypothetical protein